MLTIVSLTDCNCFIAADGGAECAGLHALALKSNPKLIYLKCGQHRLHNAEKAATKAEIPDLVKVIRIYNSAIRHNETAINDILCRLQGVPSSNSTKRGSRTQVKVRSVPFTSGRMAHCKL